MNKKNKIFIVTECPYSGVLRAVLEDAAVLVELGYSINFIVPKRERDRYGETSKSNVARMTKIGKVFYLPLRRKYRYIKSDKRALKSFLEQEKKYIALSYSGYAGKICRLLHKEGVIKQLYHVPQCVDIIRRKFFTRIFEYIYEKKLSKHSSFYLACGAAEASNLHNKYKIDRKKILLNPNSIPIRSVKKDEKRKYKYIFVGRIVKDKGIFNILEVFDLLGLLDQLIVIGDGRELEKLKNKYSSVKFLGSIPNEDVFDYFKKTEFIVSDSIIEGLPFSIIEAMSCGVVPILSNVEGHADLILDNYSGFLFKGKKHLANIIFQTQVISEDKVKNMSSNAINTVYNIRKIKKILIKSYFNKYE